MDYTPGRNLLRKSATFALEDFGYARASVPETGVLRLTPTTSSAWAKFKVDYLKYGALKNNTVTISFEAREVATGTYSTTSAVVYIYLGVYPAGREASVLSSGADRYVGKTFTQSTEWTKYSVTWIIPDSFTTGVAIGDVTDDWYISIEPWRAAKTRPVEYRNFKLEIGDVATAWSPAPEDNYPGWEYQCLARDTLTISKAIDIESYTRYYLLQSSTSNPPEVPTTDNPGGNWATSEPTYTEGSTNSLYFVDKTKFTDGTFSYSAVSLSSEYEAAKTAYNLAHTANGTANSASEIANTANTKTVYATCPTPAGTAAKVATITPTTSNYELTTGDKVTVYFTYENTAATPTLNVNSKGAKTIRALQGTAFDKDTYSWAAKTAVSFVYDGTYWLIENPDALAKAKAAATAASTANDKIDNLEVGGRNLLLDSGETITSGNYGIHAYYLSDDGKSLKQGDIVTFSFKAKIATSKVKWSIYNSGGSVSINGWKNITPDGATDVIYTWTGPWVITNGSYTGANTYVSLYIGASGQTDVSTVYWAKLERGNKATDWTPAPEDIDAGIESAQSTADTALSQSVEYIVGTQTAATGSWTGVSTDTELVPGKTIAYKLPYAGSGNASLQLTLANGQQTAEIAVYSMTTRVTTHYPAGSIINMTYDGTYWRTTGWYNSNNYDRRLHNNNILAKTEITKNYLIAGDSTGYNNIAANLEFNLSYPILWASANIAAAAAKATTYEAYPSVPFSTTGSIQSGAANHVLYLKGTVTGNTFTVAATNFLTTVIPTAEDNNYYIPLGVMSSATAGYFSSSNRLYAYINGAFQPVDTAAQILAENAQSTADGAAEAASTAGKKVTAVYGTCDTAVGKAAKVVTCANFALFNGAKITVKFSNANAPTATASTASTTLNVNGTGAKAIYFAGAVASSTNLFLWGANAEITFVYDGSYWIPIGYPCTYYGTCGTAAATAAKAVTIAQAVICKGATFNIKFTYSSTVLPTLNINATGASVAKTIYANGAAITLAGPYIWAAGATVRFMFDGQYWQLDDMSLKNHFWADSDGAHIADSSTGKNVLIDSDSVDIRDGTDVLASFEANAISLGKNSDTAKISLIDDLVSIFLVTVGRYLGIYGKHPVDGGPNHMVFAFDAPSTYPDGTPLGHNEPNLWLNATSEYTSYAGLQADHISFDAVPPGDGTNFPPGSISMSAKTEIGITAPSLILSTSGNIKHIKQGTSGSSVRFLNSELVDNYKQQSQTSYGVNQNTNLRKYTVVDAGIYLVTGSAQAVSTGNYRYDIYAELENVSGSNFITQTFPYGQSYPCVNWVGMVEASAGQVIRTFLWSSNSLTLNNYRQQILRIG